MLLGQASGHWSLKDHPFTNYGTAIGTNDHLDLSTRDTGDFACDDVRKNRLTKAVEESSSRESGFPLWSLKWPSAVMASHSQRVMAPTDTRWQGLGLLPTHRRAADHERALARSHAIVQAIALLASQSPQSDKLQSTRLRHRARRRKERKPRSSRRWRCKLWLGSSPESAG